MHALAVGALPCTSIVDQPLRPPRGAPEARPILDTPNPPGNVVFFTICDEQYFVGLVALINSLRVLGHHETVVVLDCGLTTGQKALIRVHAELVTAPDNVAGNPAVYKAFGRDMNRGGVSIIIDSDMIVTRRLDAVIALAREGRIVACNDPAVDRWFPQWTEIFGLCSPLRREPYVNAAFIAFSDRHWPDFLSRWWSRCEVLFSRRGGPMGRNPADPVDLADQDALNAILMSEMGEDCLVRLPQTAVAHCTFETAELVDEQTLECRKDGQPVTAVHWPGRPKPWEWRGLGEWWGWAKFSDTNPYIRLLRRLLVARDAAIVVPAAALPLRLRPGGLAGLWFRALGLSGRTMVLPMLKGMRILTGRT